MSLSTPKCLAAIVCMVLGLMFAACHATPPSTPLPTPDRPLVPTPQSSARSAQATPSGDAGNPVPSGPVIAQPPPLPQPYRARWRAGVGIPDSGNPQAFQWTEPRPGWYLNWHFATTLEDAPTLAAPLPYATDDPGPIPDYLLTEFVIPDDAATGMEYVPMVYNLSVATDTLTSLVQALPGRVWLLANEPDVRWQGNLKPEEYARGFHRVATLIRATDPTAQIAIGGITQVTPLRLAYLDRVWESYTEQFGNTLPVDIWNIHVFILQEKRDDWGVDIPPGFEQVESGTLWEIEDHDSLELIEAQIRAMRAWMRARGEQDKELWITEYGILMPAEFGFSEERVAAFMADSFRLFDSLRDPQLGLPTDEHRLVQRWVWFSTGYPLYPTGDLFDLDGRPTHLMQVYSETLRELMARD